MQITVRASRFGMLVGRFGIPWMVNGDRTEERGLRSTL